jgi:hypothetical protein
LTEPQSIFLLGRDVGNEDQLTEMLVWLCDAVPAAAAVVLRLALDDVDAELPVLELSTQYGIAHGRLDALIRTAGSTVIVESKLGSSYGEGQLRKYIDWLAAEHGDRPHRALMTLTEHSAPWPADDLAHATSLKVRATARRWEDLYVALAETTDTTSADFDELAARLVQEFLDMLTEEGLIPVKPLADDELTDLWSRSYLVIDRFHNYFRACKDAIAGALDAMPHSNRSSAQMPYIYQDFAMSSGELIGVGLNCSDGHLKLPPAAYRDAPYVWLTIEAFDWPDWDAAIARLEAQPPDGWNVSADRWFKRPQIWRYLDEVVGTGSFADQRARLATACGQGRAWLASAQL